MNNEVKEMNEIKDSKCALVSNRNDPKQKVVIYFACDSYFSGFKFSTIIGHRLLLSLSRHGVIVREAILGPVGQRRIWWIIIVLCSVRTWRAHATCVIVYNNHINIKSFIFIFTSIDMI